ncbi:unnamed protein product [Acanthoscelides obtectus]|uniref:Uncharacterized protein n=1 Tax=Acanthoscelides obtectus TaxID=200917 RepID=A0A9P0VPY8_ACAOB|nr:unnamed protein product [Acanthoscelides obtectus]CAK1686138.1 hypothetical protein AOBTE_LOCUS35809 [Acanthoscelides obtectus]
MSDNLLVSEVAATRCFRKNVEKMTCVQYKNKRTGTLGLLKNDRYLR